MSNNKFADLRFAEHFQTDRHLWCIGSKSNERHTVEVALLSNLDFVYFLYISS
jgi:hypothetical protein